MRQLSARKHLARKNERTWFGLEQQMVCLYAPHDRIQVWQVVRGSLCPQPRPSVLLASPHLLTHLGCPRPVRPPSFCPPSRLEQCSHSTSCSLGVSQVLSVGRGRVDEELEGLRRGNGRWEDHERG